MTNVGSKLNVKCLKRDIHRNCVSIQISGCHELGVVNANHQQDFSTAARPQEVVTGDQLEKYKICQNLFFKCVTKSNEGEVERKYSYAH